MGKLSLWISEHGTKIVTALIIWASLATIFPSVFGEMAVRSVGRLFVGPTAGAMLTLITVLMLNINDLMALRMVFTLSESVAKLSDSVRKVWEISSESASVLQELTAASSESIRALRGSTGESAETERMTATSIESLSTSVGSLAESAQEIIRRVEALRATRESDAVRIAELERQVRAMG
jgi:hypothetical protein